MGHLKSKLHAAVVVTALAMPAAAEADARADLEVGFTARTPATPSGLWLAATYKNPNDPAAKPPPLTGAVFNLPAGTVIDDSAVPQCHATDAEIRARGRNACPPESQVGAGRLVAVTGAGAPADPFDGEALFFNGDRELIEIVLVRGTDEAAGFDRITVEGSTLTAHPPPLPGGPPDGRTAVRRVELQVPAPRAGVRPYVVTPPSCPAGSLWQGTGSFKFGDGGETTVFATAPCERPGAGSLRLRVSPSSVQAGRTARLRVRVTSSQAGCAAGATVRLGRARATTDSGGRAVLRKKLSSARTVTVRASRPGCGRATARVRVARG